MRLGGELRQLVVLAVLAVGCVTQNASVASHRIVVSDGWLAMGTFFEIEIRVRPEGAERARAWIEWARDEIPRLEQIYSRHDPDSAVSILNRSLARDDVLINGTRVDPELESILFLAIEIWEASGGAFDMTIGPLVDLWTEARTDGSWPTLGQLRRAKSQVGSGALLFLGDGRLDVLTRGMRVDLDGISKGSVLDRLRERFEVDLPGAAALLNFGESSILAIGDPDGEGWRLSIRSSNGSDESQSMVRLRDQALSVSSSIGTLGEIAGERVSHIIDPRTGSVIGEGVEALVLADRAAIADGWSTALLVVGASRTTLRLIEKAGLEATVLEGSGRSVSTEGWERALLQP